MPSSSLPFVQVYAWIAQIYYSSAVSYARKKKFLLTKPDAAVKMNTTKVMTGKKTGFIPLRELVVGVNRRADPLCITGP